jgi:hypothetical protein
MGGKGSYRAYSGDNKSRKRNADTAFSLSSNSRKNLTDSCDFLVASVTVGYNISNRP